MVGVTLNWVSGVDGPSGTCLGEVCGDNNVVVKNYETSIFITKADIWKLKFNICNDCIPCM